MSLAQDIIDSGFVPKDAPQVADTALAWVLKHLRPPSGATVLQEIRVAERFSFSQDPGEVGHHMRQRGQVSGDVMWRTARMPAPDVWIEWPVADSEPYRVGFMVNELPDKSLAIAGCMNGFSNGGACPFFAMRMSGLPAESKPHMQIAWMAGEPHGRTVHAQEEASFTAWDVISSLFLLTTPRVCEIRPNPKSAKLQRARIKRGRSPLVEVKQVVLSVGIGRARYERGDNAPSARHEADARHRRLHPVLGHMRVYEKGRETPHVSWVPHHWRGDPSLGIILHDHTVRGEPK